MKRILTWLVCTLLVLPLLAMQGQASAFTLQVVDPQGNPVASGFRWLVEEDTTTWTYPGLVQVSQSQPVGGTYAPVAGPSIGLDIHSSYAPVVNKGNANAGPVTITTDINGTAFDSTKRYFVSVLPYGGYANSGAPLAPGQDSVTVTVNPLPLPTAQITVLAFVDHDPINNIFDETDSRLGGCTVAVADFSGGQMMADVFGNPLGTTYQRLPNGEFLLDASGAPVMEMMGSGIITTLTYADYYAALGLAPDGVTPLPGGPQPTKNPFNLQPGEAVVKNVSPGKYGVVLTPPGADDSGNAMTWVQTSTIEGTPTIDAWVKANEPKIFIEGFGQGVQHVICGFVKVSPMTASVFQGQTIHGLPWLDPTHPEYIDRSVYTGQITGTLRLNHFSRPPTTQGFFVGAPVPEGWVGINDPTAVPEVTVGGMYAAPCDPETGDFVINNVPPGTYQLVSWDGPLDNLFGQNTVTVPAGGGGTGDTVNLGNVLIFRWFGDLTGRVFLDNGGGDPLLANNGFPDPGEMGLSQQGVNLRFRDGTVYQATVTDPMGEYGFAEVFPFFKWLVTEVDYARLMPTGITTVVDYGGEVLPDAGWTFPSRGKLNPQPQCLVPDYVNGGCVTPLINPNTGNNLSRTDTGPVLTQAMHLFLNQFNEINWGKNLWAPGENGGISGIVYYANTRAENDPRYAAGEPWEPGVPRVQVNLYQDNLDNALGSPGPDGQIDDIDGTPGIQLADVDNYPFGDFPGPGDIDRNGNSTFDLGDALEVTATDSWDDNKPTGCVQVLPTPHGFTAPECGDSFGTWNQLRPGLFDGGYAFGPAAGGAQLPSGTYIVEANTPPGYTLVKEEDKNVDFGDSYVPSKLLLPPVCVGDTRTVPALYSFQTDENGAVLPGLSFGDLVETAYGGQVRPLCDRKQVFVNQGANVAADFFLFTETPKAGRAVGFALNDFTAEFNVNSPNFGEKAGAAWIPVAFKDWTGRELTRVYADEYGTYNAMVPGTYTANVPSPAGYAPNMMTLVLNEPLLPSGAIDPFYNPTYSVTPWTFNYMSATSSYLDTPLVPLGAFSAGGGGVDTAPVDTEPVIASVAGPEPQGGPLLCSDRPNGSNITLTSLGNAVTIINPAYDPAATPPVALFITRDFSFGSNQGQVTLNGAPLSIVSWAQDSGTGVTTVVATVPAGATGGTLMVTRGDNALTTQLGVTLNILDCAATTLRQVPSVSYPTIQSAIDAANAGDLVLVAAGTYNENVIMHKPVHLQGAGAGTTFIAANPNPLERLQAWHARLDTLGASAYEAYLLKFIFSAAEAPAIIVLGERQFPNGNVQTQLPGFLTLNPGNPFNTPGQASIDGFTMSGSVVGGGIFVAAGANYLTISNNEITNNQGNIAGGIAIGAEDVGFDQQNTNVVIRGNKIHRNGGDLGPGGIALNEYSNNYLVENNLITGNFSRFNGGGIAHRGLSPGVGTIRHNEILFNENYFNALLNQAGDAGGIYVGGDIAGGTGSGSVVIDGNLIQGNLSGSGRGGGIMGNIVNSQDVLDNPSDPTQWYELRIVNNIIVNNVAANGGAGIFLQDVARATVINNTVANNDSTSTSALAFTPGQLDSNPLPAGVVSGAHSAALQALFGAGFEQTFSNPTLVNNIIWQNRSWYNDGTTTPGVGILSPNPAGLYQDLGVVFTLTPQLLNPMYCVLTDTAGYDVSNLAPADPGFVLSYLNTLSTATVLDEGGNAINVSYPELNAALGNYHLNVGAAAMDNGAPVNIVSYPQLALDFDRQTRPSGSAVDIGADELGLTALATLAPNIPSPQSAGTSIGFSATASGGLGTFEYQFRLRTPAGVWSVPQAYSATSNWTWNTTGLATGTYRVVVWVRNAGSAAAYEAFAFVDFVLVQPATGATLTPNPVSPQIPGTSVEFTATGLGGSGTFEYQFRLRTPAGVWSVSQPYSATPTWTWNTTGLATGTYRLVVWVRNAGSAATYQAFASVDYLLAPPATGATLTPNPLSPQLPGASVDFAATGSGGLGTYEYQFRLRTPAGVWSVSQPYSATPTWTWNTTGLATGTYRLVVWVRNAGSSATYEAFSFQDYVLQ